jgi:Glycosyl transferase family 2
VVGSSLSKMEKHPDWLETMTSTNETPRVTIGMPVRNGAEHIEEAITSLLGQIEADFVLHISDNCSDDATPRICARFAAEDSRIHYERQSQNLGVIANFEYVRRAARTPYFMWAAHDDRWDPTFLTETLRLLSSNPSAIGSMCAVAFIDSAGEHLYTRAIPARIADPDPIVRARAAWADGFYAVYGLFRTEMLVSSGVVLEEIPATDIAFIYGLSLYGPIMPSNRTLSTRRLLGYSEAFAPNGRVTSAKGLGPDAEVYIARSGDLCGAMLRHTVSAPISVEGKFRLCCHVARVWSSRSYGSLVWQTGRTRVVNAWRQRLFLKSGLLALAHIVLRPTSVVDQSTRLVRTYVDRLRRTQAWGS